jgi:hypothetical protein
MSLEDEIYKFMSEVRPMEDYSEEMLQMAWEVTCLALMVMEAAGDGGNSLVDVAMACRKVKVPKEQIASVLRVLLTQDVITIEGDDDEAKDWLNQAVEERPGSGDRHGHEAGRVGDLILAKGEKFDHFWAAGNHFRACCIVELDRRGLEYKLEKRSFVPDQGVKSPLNRERHVSDTKYWELN